MRVFGVLLAGFLFCAGGAAAQAQDSGYSPALAGPLGLNTVPSARMNEMGTISAGISTLDPYAHMYLGFQLAKPLYIGLRQSAEVSDINEDADRLYPGVDFKIRLWEETRSRPELALGLQSAIGHKRMAGEYLAASKRWEDFDFTAGIGWGRFGSAGHFSNPLKTMFSHFGKHRALDGEMPNQPADWFTGENIGLFGGVEYFTPITGLSLKADYGADRYVAEQTAFGYDRPAPWSVGASYTPPALPWMNVGVAAQGTDKIMARLSLKSFLPNWRTGWKKEEGTALNRFRAGSAVPGQMGLSAQRENIRLYDIEADRLGASAKLALDPNTPAPYQFGRVAVHMANHAGGAIEELTLIPTVMGLRGPSVRLMRGDFERALAHHQGSAAEIWRGAEFTSDGATSWKKLKRPAEAEEMFSGLKLALDTRFSLAEEDSGLLYRTSVVGGFRGPRLFGFIDQGIALRLNVADNLDRLEDIRPVSAWPVRSDVAEFAQQRVALDESWLAFTHSFKPDLHLSLMGGYLEEMYAGLGGEILYRPFNSRLAVGAEAFQAFKRAPYTVMNLGFNGDYILSGHVNAWYDLPYHDLTLKAEAGRYLAGDVGGGLTLSKEFKNGVKLEGFVTVTNYGDPDQFGGTTHAYNGLRLSLPLGGFKYVPQGTQAKFRAEPFGRDTGQSLENPIPLYELTEQFSYDHMAEQWDGIVK